ncbi:MAG: Xaa-Pro peptidase family protein [Candidatus Micrarchaeota archaeon]|nr:Xaa-Pro peptidase family protein [Candidatus Micrarchaeota archaeon]
MQEINKRFAKFIELLDSTKSDYILFSNRNDIDPNSIYLGLEIPDSYVLISKDKVEIYTSKIALDFVEFVLKSKVKKILPQSIFDKINLNHDLENLEKIISRSQVLINGDKMLFSETKKYNALKIIDASENFRIIRSFKSSYEVRQISKAVKITKKIFTKVISATDLFSNKLTEIEISSQLKTEALRYRVELAFEPIVASNYNSRFPHAIPSDKRITKMCLIDFGIKYNNYCADLTRCFFDNSNSKKEKEIYDIAIDTFYEIISKIESGESIIELAKYYEKKCKEISKDQLHSLGHGVGLEIHEYPTISIKIDQEVDLRQKVIAIEPGFYFDNFGVRYEDTIYVDKNNKVKVL